MQATALAGLVLAAALGWESAIARDLPLRDLDGRAIEVGALRGRVVLIDIWATWCAPCLADLPLLRALRKEHGPRLAIVGVSLDSMPRRDFISWLRRHDVDWPQHYDGRAYASPVARRLGIEALPATLLIAPDGTLAARNLRGARLAAAIANLAGGAAADRARPEVRTP